MKLLINICAQDGIISHNCGVGTMVKRYIDTFIKIFENNNINYHINLFTPEYRENGFGYSDVTKKYNENLENVNIYEVSNGTDGKKFFGLKANWEIISNNIAKIINTLPLSEYDYVITLANDTPFAGILPLIQESKKHFKIWIPHSTAKIHQTESLDTKDAIDRIKWEENIIEYINNNDMSYLGAVGKYITKHLIEEYNLNSNKVIPIFNGEMLFKENKYEENETIKNVYQKINKEGDIILSFGRPEKYKNLDASMKIAKELNMRSIIVTQEYYPDMPYVNYLKELARETKTELYLNTSFHLPQYILNNYENNIVLIVPSKKEIAGLVINEIRRFNKDNILLVANDVDGLNEQIDDEIDGILINTDNIKSSANKIRKYLNKESIVKINCNSQKRLKKDYDFEENCKKFLFKLIGGLNE